MYTGLPTPRFYEIEPQERISNEHHRIFSHRPDLAAHGTYQTDLVCLVHEVDLMETIREIPYDTQEGQRLRVPLAKGVIVADRHCPAWYPYTPGFSPTEHYEELRMQRIEDDRRAFEMKLFELGQRAQENSLKVAEDSKAIVGDLKDIARANDKFSRRVTALVIMLAIIQTIGTLLALPSVLWAQRLWHHFLVNASW